MPKLTEAPEKLRPYLFHRIELNYEGTNEPKGDCPFCGGEARFFVSRETGMYDCKLCPSRGNVYTFLRELHTLSLERSKANLADYKEPVESRKLSSKLLIANGLCKSVIDGEWILPTMKIENKEVNNLYRWSFVKDKRRCMSTPGMFTLFGMQFWDPAKPDVYICEGPWDSISLRYTFAKEGMLEEANVVGAPGAESFKESWTKDFAGKNVFLLYDNDHPKTRNGRVIPPGGYEGMKAAAKKLRAVARTINYLAWGEEGYNVNLNDGFDVRDILSMTDEQTASVSA